MAIDYFRKEEILVTAQNDNSTWLNVADTLLLICSFFFYLLRQGHIICIHIRILSRKGFYERFNELRKFVPKIKR